MIVSLITDCEVELIVELPERNCGTIGVARVLTGNINKTSSQSLVNFYANGSRGDATCTRSKSTTTILDFDIQHQATILNQQTLMVISTLQQLLVQLKRLMVFSLVGQVHHLKLCQDGK